MLGLLQVPIEDTDQAIGTFKREKRVELGTSGVRHQDRRVTTKRRGADARDALQLLASRSLQREPPIQRAELALPCSHPLPACLREGRSSEHHTQATTHQPTSPNETSRETDVPQRIETRPNHTAAQGQSWIRTQFPASQTDAAQNLVFHGSNRATTSPLPKEPPAAALPGPFPKSPQDRSVSGTVPSRVPW